MSEVAARDEIDDLVDWQLEIRVPESGARDMFEVIDRPDEEDWEFGSSACRWNPEYGWIRPSEMDSIRRMLAMGNTLLAEQTWKL